MTRRAASASLGVATSVILLLAGCTEQAMPVFGAPDVPGAPVPFTPEPTTTPGPVEDVFPEPSPLCEIGPEPLSENDIRCIDRVIDAAVGYLVDQLDEIDPASMMVLDYLHRRWDIPQLSGVYNAALLRLPEAEPESIYARMFGPRFEAPAQSLANAGYPERLIGAVLSCQRKPLGPEDGADFVRSVTDGEFKATHAIFAYELATELGCTMPDQFDLSAAINRVSAELQARPVVDDLGIQQGVYLHLAGAGELVDSDWASQVVAAQLDDASWHHGGHMDLESGPAWHTTGLAVWFLSQVAYPEARDVPLLR